MRWREGSGPDAGPPGVQMFWFKIKADAEAMARLLEKQRKEEEERRRREEIRRFRNKMVKRIQVGEPPKSTLTHDISSTNHQGCPRT
jgi:hypothetical protein